MPASDDGSQEGTLYFQWFDRGSNRIKAFHPSRSGDERCQDLSPAGTNVTAFSISADGSTMALLTGDANTLSVVYLLDTRHPRSAHHRLTRLAVAVHAVYSVSPVQVVHRQTARTR